MARATRRQVLAGAAVSSLAGPAAARTRAAGSASGNAASALLQRRFDSGPAPALSAAVADVRGVRWAQALGQVDLELGTTATTGHLFPLGSVSKVLTATLAARLASRGVVDLAAPIARWLPDLPPQHRATTLLQLLTHRGGIRHYSAAEADMGAPGGAIWMRFYPTDTDVLGLFIADSLVAAPGTAVHYSSFGYTLASLAMAAAAGQPFLALIERELRQGFGLNSLVPDDPFAVVPARAGQYMNDLDAKALCRGLSGAAAPRFQGSWANLPFNNPAYCWAGAGLLMSPSDAARFGAAMIAPSPRGLRQSEHDLLFTPVTAANGAMPPLGLGWRIDTDKQARRRWHHAGATPGGCYFLAVYPDLGLAVAIGGNVMTMKLNVAQAAAELIDVFARTD